MNIDPLCTPSTNYECQVRAIATLSANTFQVDLHAPEDVCLNYHPGQYLQLELDVNNDGQPKALSYSIANSFNPKQPHHLQIFIQNSGAFTAKILQHLGELNKRKESAKVRLPMGKAFLQTDLDNAHILIAAGSGISKIKCIAEEIINRRPDAKVNIYWSNKHSDDFYLLDRFQDWVKTYKGISFTAILETQPKGWRGRSGVIYEIIEDDFDSLSDAHVYLCGSPRMVYGTIDMLKSKGLKEKNCYSDVFEYAPREQSQQAVSRNASFE